MRPDDRELDEEIRGHIALSVKDRIERGEDPESARRAAYLEFGYVPAIRDSMRQVWYSRWFDAGAAFLHDMRVGLRSLMRAKGLAATIVITLALGIGANAAIFSVVREVLMRPLVNRDQDRLIYIRQSAPGTGTANTTFSVPEVDDLKSRVTTISAFGDFSTIDFTLVGLGDPRVVQAGVVSGAFFEVMGLRPMLGRLINETDDLPDAEGVAVLTHRFWASSLNSDPTVIGRSIRLGARAATVVGVLEPAVPYPDDTEIIANVVTSPHHASALMENGRTHRMTELFGRLAPGATLEAARAELTTVHAEMMREHPESYAPSTNMRISATRLRDQLAAPARPVLLLLLAAAGVVFIIACSNVASLILARSVRREGELAVRAALGASPGALRRTLLAESVVLCGAGAMIGVALAGPFVSAVSSFAARFSIRALDVTVDASLLWVGAGLAMFAAIVLAYVPRLPATLTSGPVGARRWRKRHQADSAHTGFAPSQGGLRVTAGTNRRLRAFAVTQIALSFMLLAGAGMLLASLVARQTAKTGFNMEQVLAIDVPSSTLGLITAQEHDFYQEVTRRVGALPGVEGVAMGSFVPWRDAGGASGPRSPYAVEGYTPENGEEPPRARLRMVSPGFFDVVGIPLIEGRDFTSEDNRDAELVVIVSESVVRRMFPDGNALNRRMWWTDPYFGKPQPRRIIGVVADADDVQVVSGPAPTVYHPVRQLGLTGRLFVRAAGDPYAIVPAVTKIIQGLSVNQPVERAATLADVRAQVLQPERVNAFVSAGFAGVALLIAVVGVAGVLAFSVSARTREFGVRLAIGSTPRHLLMGVLSDGALIVAIGIVAGAAGGLVVGRVAGSVLGAAQLPGPLTMLGAAAVLACAALLASLMPAARAARVDVLQALRTE